MRTRVPALRTVPSRTYHAPRSRPACVTSTTRPLYWILLWRATTENQRALDSAVVISAVMPSAKDSCSGSALMAANGITAIDGLSGSGSALADPEDPDADSRTAR